MTSWSTNADVSGRMRCGSTVRPRGWIDAALRSTSTVTSLGAATDAVTIATLIRCASESDAGSPKKRTCRSSADLSSSSSKADFTCDDQRILGDHHQIGPGPCLLRHAGRRATGRRSLRPPAGDSPRACSGTIHVPS